MTTITRENFTAAMRKAVADRGADYVYPAHEKAKSPSAGALQCVYSLEDGTPSCLIGQALYNIDPELMPAHGVFQSAEMILINLGVTDTALTSAAASAQYGQDHFDTWGNALNSYESELGLELTQW